MKGGLYPVMTMTSETILLKSIGGIRSPLKDLRDCAPQESEGDHMARIEIDPEYAEAMEGLREGAEILVLTWLHLADRTMQKVHPRGNPNLPLTGVFATRSPHRPNPIGLHRTRIVSVVPPCTLIVRPLEVVDETPVVDIKSIVPWED